MDIAPARETLDQRLAHDPIGTLLEIVGAIPCPPGTALLLCAMESDGEPRSITRGTPADLQALERKLPE